MYLYIEGSTIMQKENKTIILRFHCNITKVHPISKQVVNILYHPMCYLSIMSVPDEGYSRNASCAV